MSDNSRWQEFNSIIDNEELTHDEKLLLLIIFRFVNNKSKKSYPSIETLKKLYGTKRNETIFSKLKNLYQKGYLIKKQGYQNRNEYTIVFPQSELCTKSVSSTEKSNEVVPKNGNKVVPKNGKQKEKKNKIKENNIYSHWNSKKIIVHKSLTQDMEKAIEKALKKYSDNEIVQAISTYAEILESDFYFNYKWSLVDFLNRKNGISTFMEDGRNKANYDEYLTKQSKEMNNNTKNSKEVHLRGWD